MTARTFHVAASALLVLTVCGAGPSPAGGFSGWLTLTDTREGAFSVEVPADWRASAELVRLASVDVRPEVRAVGPDGAVTVFLGDREVAPCVVPNQILEWTGHTEGSSYSPGYGVVFTVSRYLPGSEFAAAWVGVRFRGARIMARQDYPEAAGRIAQLQGSLGQLGMGARYDLGAVWFETGEAVGYVVAATQLVQSGDIAQWTVQTLVGFVADPRAVSSGQGVLDHMVRSVRWNPQWVRSQQGTTGDVSGVVSETSNTISQVMRSAWAGRQASEDRLSQRRSQANRGVDTWSDPLTGERFELEAGPEHYWIDPQGRIVGTPTDQPPGRFFRRMEQ